MREGGGPVLGRGHVGVAGEACTGGPGPVSGGPGVGAGPCSVRGGGRGGSVLVRPSVSEGRSWFGWGVKGNP